MDKYLIVGLGNPGDEYAETRHNAGYMVLDAFAKASNIVFDDKRYGYVAETSIKGRKVFLLKPTTFMNLSGNAVRYWLGKENIDQSRLLVVGHIQQLIGQNYARLRMGIGNDFPQGMQIQHVLGHFTPEERELLQPAIDIAVDVIRSFVLAGIDITMNQYNKLGKQCKKPLESTNGSGQPASSKPEA